VVDPDVGRGLDADSVAIVGQNLGDLQVAQDNVADVLDVQTDTSDGWLYTVNMVF
jgi:hypothetical protein